MVICNVMHVLTDILHIESAAACISDMLIHVSQGSYGDGLRMADYFVTHVEVLFAAIDDLVSQYHAKSLPDFQHERESRMLCRKIINFFTLLSQTQETGLRRMGITEDLLSLVTRLAHFLKGLIRVGLKAALKLVSLCFIMHDMAFIYIIYYFRKQSSKIQNPLSSVVS